MESMELPRTVDKPKKFLIWDWMEFMCVIAGFGFGIVISYPVTCAGIAGVLVYYYGRFREGKPDLYVVHAMYWIGLGPGRAKTLINPYIRQLLP